MFSDKMFSAKESSVIDKVMIEVNREMARRLKASGYRSLTYRMRNANEPYVDDDGKVITNSGFRGWALILEKLPPVMPPEIDAMLRAIGRGKRFWIAWGESGRAAWFEFEPYKSTSHWLKKTGEAGLIPKAFAPIPDLPWQDSAMQLPEEPPKLEGRECWLNENMVGKDCVYRSPENAEDMRQPEGETVHYREVK